MFVLVVGEDREKGKYCENSQCLWKYENVLLFAQGEFKMLEWALHIIQVSLSKKFGSHCCKAFLAHAK